MHKLSGILILLLTCTNAACGQQQQSYPEGITVDPGIEKTCRSKKTTLNGFHIKQWVNDSISTTPFFSDDFAAPLSCLVTTDNKDTVFTFFGLLLPLGFQIRLNNPGCEVKVYASSKSCRCFKQQLSDAEAGYAASAPPLSLTLVMSKTKDFRRGEKIYGYIKTKGGDFFMSRGQQGAFDKMNLQFEGYFEVDFNPLQQ